MWALQLDQNACSSPYNLRHQYIHIKDAQLRIWYIPTRVPLRSCRSHVFNRKVAMAPKLRTRQLGRDGPQVTAIGYGAMGLSAYYAPAAPDEERLEFLDYVYNSGIVNWDTSDVYGDSEDLIGKWLAKTGKRNELFLATKGGGGVDGQGNALVRSNPEYIKDACYRSLRRLGTDFVDLYYIHRLDKVTPIETTVAAMVELKKEGKIRYLGLSECSATTLRRALVKLYHELCARLP